MSVIVKTQRGIHLRNLTFSLFPFVGLDVDQLWQERETFHLIVIELTKGMQSNSIYYDFT